MAYLTTKPRMKLTRVRRESGCGFWQPRQPRAAGFTIASQDLDIRGAGNIVGEEQSGQMREVGFELYQSMLEEAIAKIRSGEAEGLPGDDGQWSPQINLGVPVLIPEAYVPDLDVRPLGRLPAAFPAGDQGGSWKASPPELIDRFGSLGEGGEHAAAGGADQGDGASARIFAKWTPGPEGP